MRASTPNIGPKRRPSTLPEWIFIPSPFIIACVTYLLALAPVIAYRAGSLSIPVYFGDAMQLSTTSIMGLTDLVIAVPPPLEAAQLRFPEIFCKEIGLPEWIFIPSPSSSLGHLFACACACDHQPGGLIVDTRLSRDREGDAAPTQGRLQ